MGRPIQIGQLPTERQREILKFIADRLETGVAPSMREVGDALGITSTNGFSDHYKLLLKRGFIERDALKSRSIRLTDAGYRAVGISACRHCGGTGRAS